MLSIFLPRSSPPPPWGRTINGSIATSSEVSTLHKVLRNTLTKNYKYRNSRKIRIYFQCTSIFRLIETIFSWSFWENSVLLEIRWSEIKRWFGLGAILRVQVVKVQVLSLCPWSRSFPLMVIISSVFQQVSAEFVEACVPVISIPLWPPSPPLLALIQAGGGYFLHQLSFYWVYEEEEKLQLSR